MDLLRSLMENASNILCTIKNQIGSFITNILSVGTCCLIFYANTNVFQQSIFCFQNILWAIQRLLLLTLSTLIVTVLIASVFESCSDPDPKSNTARGPQQNSSCSKAFANKNHFTLYPADNSCQTQACSDLKERVLSSMKSEHQEHELLQKYFKPLNTDDTYNQEKPWQEELNKGDEQNQLQHLQTSVPCRYNNQTQTNLSPYVYETKCNNSPVILNLQDLVNLYKVLDQLPPNYDTRQLNFISPHSHISQPTARKNRCDECLETDCDCSCWSDEGCLSDGTAEETLNPNTTTEKAERVPNDINARNTIRQKDEKERSTTDEKAANVQVYLRAEDEYDVKGIRRKSLEQPAPYKENPQLNNWFHSKKDEQINPDHKTINQNNDAGAKAEHIAPINPKNNYDHDSKKATDRNRTNQEQHDRPNNTDKATLKFSKFIEDKQSKRNSNKTKKAVNDQD